MLQVIIKIVWLSTLVFFPAYSNAELTQKEIINEIVSCTAISDSTKRLACYDSVGIKFNKINLDTNSNQNEYLFINFSDFKVDIKDLVGKRLSTKALIQVIGELSMLKSDPMDMSPVWVTTDLLPREDRKKLANGCQAALCGGQFYGTINKTPLGIGLILEKVEWK